jgi:hypothetical protein
VAQERRAGTLDQLRTTPAPPLGLLFGLAFGAPARLYLLAAGPLGLHVLSGLCGTIPLESMLGSTAVLLVGGAALSLIAAALALVPQRDHGGSLLALGVAGLFGFTAFLAMVFAQERTAVSWAFLHPAGALHATMLGHDGLWRRLFVSYWGLTRFEEPSYTGPLFLSPILSLGLSLLLGGLFARAACRRLAAPHVPLFSKRQALVLFAVAAAAIILPLHLERSDYSPRYAAQAAMVMGIFLLPLVALLALLSSPSFEAWAMALRRGRRPSPFEDDAAPHLLVALMVAIYAVLVCVRLGPAGMPRYVPGRYLVAMAWAGWLALTLGPIVLFGQVRFSTLGARTAYAVGLSAYYLFQMIAVGVVTDRYLNGTEEAVLQAGGLIGLAVPLVIAHRLRALRRRTLAR